MTCGLSPGHGAMAAAEAEGWLTLIRNHLGAGKRRAALDLGCGTGAMPLLHRAEFRVKGLDLAEPVLDRARRKAEATGARIAFRLADAGTTREPGAAHDMILMRNLFRTLPGAEAALHDWWRILRHGGRVMIVNRGFARLGWIRRRAPVLDPLLGKLPDGHALVAPAQWQAHHHTMARLPYGKGLRGRDAAGRLARAGCTAICREGLGPVLVTRHPPPVARGIRRPQPAPFRGIGAEAGGLNGARGGRIGRRGWRAASAGPGEVSPPSAAGWFSKSLLVRHWFEPNGGGAPTIGISADLPMGYFWTDEGRKKGVSDLPALSVF